MNFTSDKDIKDLFSLKEKHPDISLKVLRSIFATIKLWLKELSEVQEWEEVPGQSSKPTSTPPPPWTDNSDINQFLQMAWTKAPYSHILLLL
ncbi:hypothetical protein P691DRAFT_768627 [Macrolepiota fuliginosa MF-IS2]|uniref:Uncharacterized protein n=1 Tax=Macrolepiota fuliginosa MF-IS2 TaxID=1400762 RepID=A0A9P5WW36_9AGAR|nr:hypothetical protein P691DRAFT_768627 [Macrolepiota fuliginosa MF-IS2]